MVEKRPSSFAKLSMASEMLLATNSYPPAPELTLSSEGCAWKIPGAMKARRD